MNKRLKKKMDKHIKIMAGNDPLAIARRLVEVLEENGYSTNSWDNIENYHSFDIKIHGASIENPITIENMAQKWRLREDRSELPF